MINLTSKEKCCGCRACSNICPKHCVQMVEDDEGFKYPVIDTEACVNCGLCETVCPFNSVDCSPRNTNPTTYVSYSNDDALRGRSSSGGLFSELAKRCLELNGAVYGVAMSNDILSAGHVRITRLDELDRLRGSKYLQSDTNNVFQEVKSDLDGKKQVLFSGTPCQIDALKHYLRKSYENLLLVEVICHGVPSPKLWIKYIEYLEESNHTKIESVNFRDKTNGWKRFGLSEKGAGFSQIKEETSDPYLVMFLRNCCLRPSCYDCGSKKHNSSADITLADAWGITSFAPDFDDDKGASLVIIQTEKGGRFFDAISGKVKHKEIPFSEAIKHNPSYYSSVVKPSSRNSFFADMDTLPFRKLEKKYCSTSFLLKLKRFLARTALWKALKRVIRGKR